MIQSIHHVSYTVSDADRSIEFYREGFDFRVLSDRVTTGKLPSRITGLEGAELRIVHLRGHGVGLELIEYRRPRGEQRAARTCDVGSSHLCFIVDDIDAELARLHELGARALSEPLTVDGGPNAGNRFVYLLDPDGIPMELSQPV